MWIISALRGIFGLIDWLAYFLIEIIYELFMLISQAGIFSQASIQEFAARIYIFLGLIMVFKVSISLVTYILNPDNFNKADVGAPALLKGFVFALLGIVLVPYVFEAAYSLQNIVLKDNLIGNLILGMSDEASGNVELEDAGKNMSFVTLSAFLRLNSDIKIDDSTYISEACSINPVKDGNISDECTSHSISTIIGADAEELIKNAYSEKSVKVLTSWDLVTATVTDADGNKVFIMSYLFIISSVAGFFIAYVLLLFCVDIAVRSVKLGFLQLIAPIPLIAKVDPKKGGKIFDNWIQECVSTYLDVFLRLAAIYFVLFIITAITGPGATGIYNVVTGEGFSGVSGLFVLIFIIIGALNFARDLPKLLGKILGIDFKGMGGFTLDAKKKLGATPLIGGTLAAGAGLAGRTGMNVGKGLFTAAGEPVRALDKKLGFSKGLEGKYDSFKDSKVMQRAGKVGDFINKHSGNAMKDIGADFAQFGAQAVPFITDRERKKQDDMINALKNYAGYKSKLKEQADFDSNRYTTDSSGNTISSSEMESKIKDLKKAGKNTTAEEAALNSLKNDVTKQSTKELKQAYEDMKNSGTATAAEIAATRTAYEEAQKLSITAGKFAPISNIKREAAQFARDNALDLGSNVTNEAATYGDLNDANISANNKVIETQSSSSYIRSHSVQPTKKS